MMDNECAASAARIKTKDDGSGAMFDRIAPRYDLLNRLMSFGLDRRWRGALLEALQLPHLADGAEVLDVATGTGDVALALLQHRPGLRVTGLDPSLGMLSLAEKKRRAGNVPKHAVTFLQGDAQAMPFADNTFAAACISFGIRNVPDRKRGLEEMARVVRPGGMVVVLELGEPQDGPLRMLARFHMHFVVPFLGRLMSLGGAYAYLQQSIERFPPAPAFATLMGEAGLDIVSVQRLSFGAVYLYVGRVR